MFTTQHYTKIAESLNLAIRRIEAADYYEEKAAALETVMLVVKYQVDIFIEDNPAFNSLLFKAAVYTGTSLDIRT